MRNAIVIVSAGLLLLSSCGKEGDGGRPNRREWMSQQDLRQLKDEVRSYEDQDIKPSALQKKTWLTEPQKLQSAIDPVSTTYRTRLALNLTELTYVKARTFYDKDGKVTQVRSESGRPDFEAVQDLLSFFPDSQSEGSFIELKQAKVVTAYNDAKFCGKSDWKLNEIVPVGDTTCQPALEVFSLIHVDLVNDKELQLESCNADSSSGVRKYRCVKSSYQAE